MKDDSKHIEEVHGYASRDGGPTKAEAERKFSERARADTMDSEPCPECGGKGEQLSPGGTGHEKETCENCYGSGRVLVRRQPAPPTKLEPSSKVRVFFNGRNEDTRVELAVMTDDGRQEVHDIPCSALGLALDPGSGNKLVLAVDDSFFEVTADVGVPTGFVDELLRATARLNNPDLRKTEAQLEEEMRREVENYRRNAAAAERELHDRFGVVLDHTMVLVQRSDSIRDMMAEAIGKRDQLLAERFARVLRDRMSGSFDGIDEPTRLELLAELVRAVRGSGTRQPLEMYEKHAFERKRTDRWQGPPDETCELCGTDPRNVIHGGRVPPTLCSAECPSDCRGPASDPRHV